MDSKESIPSAYLARRAGTIILLLFGSKPPKIVLKFQHRDGIFKLLRSPGIASKQLIPPAYVAWRAGTTTLFRLGS